ncbi:MAG: TRAP transporter small permease [Rhodocyclaceae bacterium]|jgi:TRAP-type C4-dicarboxylate transport system permease small subunit|nr:TRAP transporter small permease [Rhodocyclaceae bacterium]
MRAVLDSLYRGTGALAALGMVGTLVFVATGIVTRPLGLYLRGTDAYAGYMMAACGFLALAYTYKHGEHIRVSLLLDRLGPRARRWAEWLSLLVALAVVGALAWYSLRLAWFSWEFGDRSQGIDATPLWIPQLLMVFGSITFFIALVDDLVLRALGREPARLAVHGQEPIRAE